MTWADLPQDVLGHEKLPTHPTHDRGPCFPVHSSQIRLKGTPLKCNHPVLDKHRRSLQNTPSPPPCRTVHNSSSRTQRVH
ncbi:hypothetical protein JZ751_012380 [Albula glossodonta]|uniref:Uncharacterized protein n=1 Tax=Albula glossodonta TaxID=121402 RepID=A0A8T2PSH0_9TELE|nr:hypothetical protein JZ751_012380 [Albula glossodonta]